MLNQKKPVNFFPATILVIANMIGTGVFAALGFQLASVRFPFSAIMLWVVGGIVSFCGALSYGELGAMMPRSGGEYAYLTEIYHPAIGFLTGYVSILVGFWASIALAAMALGRYSGVAFPGVDESVVPVGRNRGPHPDAPRGCAVRLQFSECFRGRQDSPDRYFYRGRLFYAVPAKDRTAGIARRDRVDFQSRFCSRAGLRLLRPLRLGRIRLYRRGDPEA
jgi:hypothetical protein